MKCRYIISLTAIAVLFVVMPISHAATAPNSCAKALELLCSDEAVTIPDLSGDDLKALFDCANQPTSALDVNDRIYLNDTSQNSDAFDLNYCSGYTLKGSKFEVSLFSQTFAIPVLKDADGNTRYAATVGASLLGLTSGDFYFKGGKYFEMGWRDLVYFFANHEYHRPFYTLSLQLSEEGDTDDVEAVLDTVDNDRDGYAESEGDCNDGDAAVNPDAADVIDNLDEIDDDNPALDTNCDGRDGSALWRSLGEIGLYAAAFDGYRDIFSGLYTDFTESPQLDYTYGDQSYRTRESVLVYGTSLVQETFEELTELCADGSDLSTCEPFLDLLYVARAALESGDVGYLAAAYDDSSYAAEMALGLESGLALGDRLHEVWQANGYTQVPEEEEATYICTAGKNDMDSYEIPAWAVELADTLDGLASDPNTGKENTIELWLQNLLCLPQSDGSFDCSALEGSYADTARHLVSTILLDQAIHPVLDLHDPIGWGIADGFLTADNLRSALGRINESIWKVSDAFARAFDDGSTDEETEAPFSLEEFYNAESPFVADQDMYTWLYEHFAEARMSGFTDMADYLADFEVMMLPCGWAYPPDSLKEVCEVVWDRAATPAYANGYYGNFSGLYVTDIKGMMLEPSVAKVFHTYARAGYIWFYGLSRDEQISLYNTLVRDFPAVDTGDDDVAETVSGEDAINDLIVADNPTLEKLELTLQTLYTDSSKTYASGWGPILDVSDAIDGIRALLADIAVDGATQSPVNAFLQLFTRLAQSEWSTSDLDNLMHQTAYLLSDCSSALARGLGEIEAANAFATGYYEVLWPEAPIDPTAVEEWVPMLDTLNEYKMAYAPVLEDSTALYQTILALRDHGWLHYLFRDKNAIGDPLENPLTWIHYNIMESGLLSYIEQLLKMLVDAGAYPNTYIVGRTMEAITGEPERTERHEREETARDPNDPMPPPPRTN